MIKITYSYPIADGNRATMSVIVDNQFDAEDVCRTIEELIGYKIEDVAKCVKEEHDG